LACDYPDSRIRRGVQNLPSYSELPDPSSRLKLRNQPANSHHRHPGTSRTRSTGLLCHTVDADMGYLDLELFHQSGREDPGQDPLVREPLEQIARELAVVPSALDYVEGPDYERLRLPVASPFS
jgi:hypothetical protein